MKYLIEKADSLAKLSAAFIIIMALLTTLIPPLGKYAKAFAAMRFGTIGVLKYEVGLSSGDDTIWKPTSAGNLFLLRPGNRGFADLRFGDVLQSKGPNRFRENNGCGLRVPTNCSTSSPEIFKLTVGQCVVVLDLLNPDSGLDNEFVDKDGGWVRVATTPCGLFE